MSEVANTWFARFVHDRKVCPKGRVTWRAILDKRPPHETSVDRHDKKFSDIHWDEGRTIRPDKKLLGAADIPLEALSSLGLSWRSSPVKNFPHHSEIVGWPQGDADEINQKRIDMATDLADFAEYVACPQDSEVQKQKGGHMKILITGAYGFVGTNLCKYLAEKGHECHALDIPSARRPDVPYASFHTWDELDQKGDNSATQHSSFILQHFDCVVHLAGKAHDLKKVASEQSYFDINVGLTEKIFAAAKTTRFIYFSSSKADANGNAYGRSKLAAEQFLNGRAIVLRPAMIHGPGNKGNLNLLWGIARRGLPWPLAAFENKRSFTSIGNICAAVEALAERGTNGIYPIADDEMLSTNRLIELIAETCGKKSKLWRIPKGLMRFAAKIGDVLHLPLNTERIEKLTEDSFVDNSGLKSVLGWIKMPIAAEEGMRLTLKSFCENKEVSK